MNPDEFVLLNQYGPIIIGQGELSEFDASANAGLFVYAPRWPLLASAPATVVDGQSWRIAEAGQDYGREYLGVAGAWVPQASVTMAMWVCDAINWIEGDQIPAELTASGTGAGVLTIRLKSTEANALSLSGGGRFYSNEAGTLGETTSVTLTANVATTLYVKLPSGKSTLWVQKGSKIIEWGSPGSSAFTTATNSPTLTKFNTKYISADATYIWFGGDLITVSGTTYPWTSATYIWFDGNLITVSGTTYPWTSATYIMFNGSSLTVSGTTYPWTSATYIWFGGNLITVSGTTYPWTSATYIRFGGNLIQLAYVTKTWRSTISKLYISSSSMTSSMVNQALIDIDASGTTAIGEKSINLSGRCGAVTSASTAARDSLAAKAFTVTVNL